MPDITKTPLMPDDIEEIEKDAENWHRTRWGSPMDPAKARGWARDLLRLVNHVKTLEAELKRVGAGANTDDDFNNNPCTMCGSAPGVRCPHDE